MIFYFFFCIFLFLFYYNLELENYLKLMNCLTNNTY